MTTEKRATDIGQRLAAARVRLGLSQGTIARRARLAPSYVSRVENGKVHPTFRTVQRIANAMRVPLDEIAAEPSAMRRPTKACPISDEGTCLLDLICNAPSIADAGRERYSPAQVRVLRRVAALIRGIPPECQRALETVLDEMAGKRHES